ncbi:tryptophan 7-halogenase [Solwaraspora sp. WMMD791]|uniref:FAD-dependent oxidoreductase n=1 Tax=Solwaraspora sp. WMMD791 TaxID=3016086 RepID=UPI00249A1D55|nr:FAD-dependent oxidoreductase [Solwaraspora sp. WMMD791]WFE29248.1 tryptophan 7-halogenase [Solwaraspora sp. WMMD791]
MSVPQQRYDLIVVGGGPAGATVSALVSKRGHRVLLLEKATFPRYQIGESLLPATVHGVAHLLGVREEIEKAGFTVKRGGTFRWGSSPQPWTFEFAVSQRMPGPTSFAYQVERMRFDQILLDNARRLGVDVRENSPVTGVITDGGRVSGVRYTDRDGREQQVSARYVVDASGNTSRLYGSSGARREYSPFFRNLALFGYFEGGARLPAPNSGNIFSVAFEHGWFWYIPLRPELTSVGAVVSPESAALVQGDPEQAMRRFIDACPPIQRMLANATRVTEGPYAPLRVRKDWSYCGTRFWSPGMVLVGDAACFVDPVFSSGVHLATFGGLLAARSINACLADDVDEATAFDEFETRYRREYGRFYEFLIGFYDMHQSETSYFWQARKISNTAENDIEAFVNLVGGVASDEFADPALTRKRFTETSREMTALVDTASAQHDATMGAVAGRLLEQGAALQARALTGSGAGEGRPVTPAGLMPSADGLSWIRPERSA